MILLRFSLASIFGRGHYYRCQHNQANRTVWNMSGTDEQLLILRKFPHLVPQCKQFCSYRGLISAGTEQFHVTLEVPHYPSQHGLQLKSSSRMQRLLRGKVPPLGDSLFESLCNVQLALESATSSEATAAVTLAPLSRLCAVSSDATRLSAARIVTATAALDCVVLGLRDGAGRRHRLALRQRGTAFTLHAAPDLPLPLPAPSSVDGSLCSWASPWRGRVGCLQPLWARLAELDGACWVTDPVPPALAHMHRRIALGGSVWAQVTLDPNRPWERPDLKLFGPEEKLEPIAASLHQSLANDDWDPQAPLTSSLLSALGLAEFPPPPILSSGMVDRAGSPLVRSSECAICFEARDQSDALPEEACQGKTCPAHFHASCLFQWLDTLRCQTDFRRIRGACPNCDAPISCPAP